MGEPLGAGRDIRPGGVAPHEDQRVVAHRWPVVRDRGPPNDELVRKPVPEVRGPFPAHRAGLVLHVVPAPRQLVTVPGVGQRRGLREPVPIKMNQLVLVHIDQGPRQLDVVVDAQLQIKFPEQVGLRVVDLRRPPGPGVDPERIGEDARHRVEPRLRDPDAGGVARGAELDARRKRAVVVAEVAGDEEVKPVADDRAAHGETVLLLLIVGDGYGHAVRIAAHEILVLHVPERRPMELVGAGLGDRVDQAADEPTLPHVERRDQDLVLLHCLDRERARVHAAARNLVARAQRE